MLTIRVAHPGGTELERRILALDISAGGAGVIHPGYLHTGTSCRVMWKIRSGRGEVECVGRVVSCRHLRRNLHVTGIRWDQAIDVRAIVGAERWLEAESQHRPTSGRLTGRVLHVCEDQSQADAADLHLGRTGLEMHWAQSLGSACDAIKTASHDLIIVDLDGSEGSAMSFIETCRREGYRGPILAATVDPASEIVEMASTCGANEVLRKPYTADVLSAAVRSLLISVHDPLNSSKAIVSDLGIQDPRIERYLQRVRRKGEELSEAISKDDCEHALAICRDLQSTGGSFGYPLLSEVAGKAVTQLHATMSAAESQAALRTVIRIIHRLRAGDEPVRGEPMQEAA